MNEGTVVRVVEPLGLGYIQIDGSTKLYCFFFEQIPVTGKSLGEPAVSVGARVRFRTADSGQVLELELAENAAAPLATARAATL